MSLGARLRYLRWKSGKTLSEQSRNLKVSLNTVHRWEQNKIVPRGSSLERLAEYFGVPPMFLLSNSKNNALSKKIEQELLTMFREMPEGNKFKTLKYAKRMSLSEECE